MAGAKGLFLAGYLLSGGLCSELTISYVPEHIEALSGSCVLIPCTFNIPKENADELKKQAGGIWIQNVPQFKDRQRFVVFNSSKARNPLSGEIVGDLVQKNCTTVLDNITEKYTDKYYFRIETPNYKTTFPNTPVKITVRGSPHKPSITKLKELNVGTTVDLKCRAAAPCNKHLPVLAWTPNLGDSRHQLLTDSHKIKSVLSILTFTPSHLHHGKNITCSAQYALQAGGEVKVTDIMTLNVLFPPQNTKASISPSGPLLNGSPVTLTCSSWANPPVSHFTWFRTIETTVRSFGRTLTFNVSSGDAGQYHCEAQNQQGIQKSGQVKLTIEGLREPFPVIGVVVGTLGVLLPCFVLMLFWRLRKSRGPCTSIRMTSTEGAQSNPSVDPSKAVNTRETTVLESPQEEVQYAEIELSKLRAQGKGKRGKEDRQGQETEYAEIQFSERKGKAPIEDVYAEVKPKSHR